MDRPPVGRAPRPRRQGYRLDPRPGAAESAARPNPAQASCRYAKTVYPTYPATMTAP